MTSAFLYVDINYAAFTRRRSETIHLRTVSRSFAIYIDFTSGKRGVRRFIVRSLRSFSESHVRTFKNDRKILKQPTFKK